MREFDFNVPEEQLRLSDEQIAAMMEEAQREEYREISERENTMQKLAKFLDSVEDYQSDMSDAIEEIQRKLDGIQKTLDEHQSQNQHPA